MSAQAPIKVAILWHMHQPDYREPGSDRLAMPWVRLHATKDYLDMPLTAALHDGIKVTFNLVPSLIDQLELYSRGGIDRHLELSRLRAEDLSSELRLELLQTFFTGHQHNMIDVHSRYAELHEKFTGSATRTDVLPALFTSAELRDLQVWSNLAWVDPSFAREEPINSLLAKERHFTEDDKQALLDWQLDIIGRIVPTYKSLMEKGVIDVSFTPYYHPILPLLCDTDIAREALPGISLPKKRFVHPEDAERQVEMSCRRFEVLFDRPLTGMWPSEGSISEEALDIIKKHGIGWAASDERVLYQSLAKSALDRSGHHLHGTYDYNGLRLFFRDQGLSDRIGFVYSTWGARQAAADFLGHLHRLRDHLADHLDRAVVPVILDGENAWEYFPDDGSEFLQEMYSALASDPKVELVTMSEAADSIEPYPLPSVFAGSWINNNFRIWIGHEEDNAAWDLLSRTRETVEKAQESRSDLDRETIDWLWNQIYIAQGSDWCWWYGDEHRGEHNRHFDLVFRRHLQAVYQRLGLDIPMELVRPIHSESVASFTVLPDDILTAQIDGRITHFYEWTGAGFFDCAKAGMAMHRVDRQLSGIYFGYDHNRFYIRLDFADRKRIDLLNSPECEISLLTPTPRIIRLPLARSERTAAEDNGFEYVLGEILELAVDRSFLWSDGFGSLGLSVSVFADGNVIEHWPEQQPIQLDVPERDQEIFWPS